MAAQAETVNPTTDVLRWVVAVTLTAGAIWGFYFFAAQPTWLRILGLLIVAGVAIYVAVGTVRGQVAKGFLKDANIEVRKVVWPSRKETVQTTLFVIAMVALVAVILWIMDGIFGSLVRWILGQEGG